MNLRRSPFAQLLAWSGLLSLGLAGCSRPKQETMATTPSGPKEQAARTAAAPEDLRRKWIFLNRIRQDDAFNDWLNRTMLTDDNQLGIVVSSPLTAKELSSRVEQLLKRLAAPSPGETLILKAYAPGKPLRLLGTGTRHGENGAFSWTPAP